MRPGPRLRSVGTGERGRVRDRHFVDDAGPVSALRLTPASPAPAGVPAPGLLDAVRAPADLRGLDADALEALAAEIIEAYQGQGNAIRKRDEVHKMAQANKAFAHFRW